MVLLLFLIVFMIDTLPQYRVWAKWRRIADLVNLTTASFFAAEWVLRFYSFRRPWRYLFQPLTIVDVLGIFPGFIKYTTGEHTYFGNVKWLRALQVLRVLRILRLTEYSVELYVTIRTLRRSATQIAIVMMAIAALLLTGCFLLFYAENDSLDLVNVQWMRKNHGVSEPSPYQNVFFCLYWGFVTITTVGYGDYTPVSPWGQVIACLTMFMGVFTIVFPTSIISNNFASEWDAFRKAQKLHEQRILQRQTHGRRHELKKVMGYANQSYNESGVEYSGVSGNEEENVGYMPQEATSDAGPSAGPSAETIGWRRFLDRAKAGTWDSQRVRQDEYHEQSFSPSGDTPSIDESSRIGPAEYGHLIDISKRVEENLGIPGISLGGLDMDSEVNQNLVVSAMFSKLYNQSFSILCERLVLRLVDNLRLESVDEVAELLEYHPESENVVRSWPHDNKLSMLEYKLLGYVFNNLKGRLRRSFEFEPHHDSSSAGGRQPSASMDDTRSLPLRRPGARNPVKKIRRRIRSKLTDVTGKLALPRVPTHQSVHDYMSADIAGEHRMPRSQKPSGLNLARRAHLNNMHRSNTRVDLRDGRADSSYLELGGGDSQASGSGIQHRRPGSVSSPAIAITVPSTSEDLSPEDQPAKDDKVKDRSEGMDQDG
ncbi:hypothetical protein GGF43_001359 [Coemansia sp. RSA 2618]|nr:hypothetical protein GGF43_001359 [Coemansia sp. RSA 2618]